MSDKCPKCDYKYLKTWEELSEDEKYIIRVKNSETLGTKMKMHRYCKRCGFEEKNPKCLLT